MYTDRRISITGSYTLAHGEEKSSLSIPYWSHHVDGRFGYVFTLSITPTLTGDYQYQEPVGSESALVVLASWREISGFISQFSSWIL